MSDSNGIYDNCGQCHTCKPCEHKPVSCLNLAAMTPCKVDWLRSPVKRWVDLKAFLPQYQKALLRSKEALKVDMTATPDEILIDDIRQSAIEFAQRTGVLKRWLRYDVQKCVSDYYVELCGEERVQYVNQVVVKDCGSTVVGLNRSQFQLGQHGSYGFFYMPPSTVMVSPEPQRDIPNALNIQITAVPVRDACVVDEMLYDRYLETIIAGALARSLWLISPMQAKGMAQQFEFGVNDAKNDQYNGNTQRMGNMMMKRGVG